MEIMSEFKCRVCTKSASKHHMQNLFSARQRNMLVKIHELTGLELKYEDDLPKHICLQCDKDLEHAYTFRTLCIESQDYYNELLQSKDCLKEVETDLAPYTVEDLELTSTSYKTDEFDDYLKVEINTELSDVESKPEPKKKRICKRILSQDIPESVKRKTCHRILSQDKPQGVRSKDIICDKCGNYLASRQHFLIHMRRHNGDRRYNCEVCPDKFYTPGELKRHMRSHTGERPFPCSHCGRRFTDYSTRKKHERIHTNERPYSCEQCEKSFTTSYVLKNHMLTHTGERSFRCETCDKFYGRHTNLVTHYRSKLHKKNEEKRLLLKKQEDKEDQTS